jgi:shikimate dehydrogenase
MEISGKTKICGIIGDPLGHTVSPVMHNAAFKKLGIDYAYVPFPVRPEKLAEAVAGLRAFQIVGFNVTIPHKVAILPFLDDLDPLASKIGAVNTVTNTKGILTGYNTDAEGFFQSLMEHGINPVNKNVAVIGAGGASRAISFILSEMGAKLTVVNRRSGLERANAIAAMIQQDLHRVAEVVELEKIAEGLKGADILINTTSVGMAPQTGVSPVPAALLGNIPVVVDIVYNPMDTQLLKDAKKAGARTIGGVDMLVWQGALAFEKWTGRKAPPEIMRHEAVRMLERK